jgi:EAL domain-containing protein (putative c-di-GMP-specific phosphodiesterase class I)
VLVIARSTDPSRRAVEDLLDGEFPMCSHLQPIVRVSDGAILGFEALARIGGGPADWRPNDWLDAADHYGDAQEVELAMLDAALDRFPDIAAPAYLSVNLSPRALVTFAVDHIFGRTDVDPGRVVVEITEHGAEVEHPNLIASVERLRERGVRIAIDDVSLGFSNISRIGLLRPDVLKLDRGLIHLIEEVPQAVMMLRGITDFAAATGASVVAEGIERPSQMRLLAELGIASAQGFLIGRPALEVADGGERRRW